MGSTRGRVIPGITTWLLPLFCALGWGVPAHAALTWFKFNRAFIDSHYASGEAFGSVSAQQWFPAANTHATDCGGKDGELHIGTRDPKLALPAGQHPQSGPGAGTDSNWGIVAELPNASLGNGPSLLSTIGISLITFTGYFRVWNEGHGTGASPPSNPHHVFEVHPAWEFTAGTHQFSQPAFVQSIPNYSGYGASKYKPVLQAIKAGQWPLAFQDAQFLQLGLPKGDNFYQLPVKVKSLQATTAGHEATVDVFSSPTLANLVYADLRCLTVKGSPIDDAAASMLQEGKKLTLLGFFSVNLARAEQASSTAISKSSAVAVPNAVEFFVFGKATKSAVASCP